MRVTSELSAPLMGADRFDLEVVFDVNIEKEESAIALVRCIGDKTLEESNSQFTQSSNSGY